MNPARYAADAITTSCVVNERPDDCDHCGLLDTPVVAAVYWDSATSTTFGESFACGPCLPRIVDGAIADTRGRVTVEHLIYEPVSTPAGLTTEPRFRAAA